MNTTRYRLALAFAAFLIIFGSLPTLATPTAHETDAAASPSRAELGSLAHTYSIVARDPATGQLGVAVQSHWFQVGPIVPWAEAGVGAVATQSFVDPGYGPKGLALMKQGKTARQALNELLGLDSQQGVRQVAMVDAKGTVVAWTGERCIAEAGHKMGEGYSVQANLMDRKTVWPAMAAAYEDSADKPFAERLLIALEAAEKQGGDIRGQQSAALLVVAAEATGDVWKDRLVDLRIDDHADPLGEMRRLYNLHLAYEEMNAGDEKMAEDKVEEAVKHYTAAAKMAPDIVELPFWQAVTLYDSGRREEALPIFRQVFAAESRWAEVVRRLPAAGLLPDDPEVLEEILSQATSRVGGAGGRN
ncbi:MAG: DUF1028 domain-containing protein [Acidobacteriota bacterium]